MYTGDGKGKTTAAFGVALRAAGHGLKTFVIQFLKSAHVYGEAGASTQLGKNIEVTQFGRACPFLGVPGVSALAGKVSRGADIHGSAAAAHLDCSGCSCPCHVSRSTVNADDRRRVASGLALARAQIRSGGWDIVVLDESLYLPAIGLCSVADLLRVVKSARAACRNRTSENKTDGNRTKGNGTDGNLPGRNTTGRPIALILTGGPCPPRLAEAADLVTSITGRKHHSTRRGFSIPGVDR
ncbi:MAG: cob(I)yrinic acid a,c-diamide adenosyltransferase [Planctomycetota bacterium]|nr:cob(I)yrinic acid a,c-diamide adenosyltransferase [Planctomycetota bacterium]